MHGRQEFVRQVERGPAYTTYHLEDVRVRAFGETALVQATGVFTRADGSSGACRYTDVYARIDNAWQVFSAQVTRVANARSVAGNRDSLELDGLRSRRDT